ncbi:MAG: hypothetical protein JO325_20405 [Solirubrobacterales bacterium]|nr:hypothetical protein [Solirubrobacterales bacterium]
MRSRRAAMCGGSVHMRQIGSITRARRPRRHHAMCDLRAELVDRRGGAGLLVRIDYGPPSALSLRSMN